MGWISRRFWGIIMAAKSQSRGHKIINQDKKWIYLDNKEPAFMDRECHNCGKKPIDVLVIDYMTGKLAAKKIDYCIADIVKALQESNINMISSCCGHKIKNGWICLADGRSLIIKKWGWKWRNGQ